MGREIVYCGDCGRRLSEDEFDHGRAHFVENRPYCADCRPVPTFAAKKKHSTTHIPLPPQTTRRAMAAAGPAPQGRKAGSRAPILAGGVLVAGAFVAILVAVATGGRGGPAAPPDPAPKPVADELLPLIRDLEKLASSGAEPEAILTACDRVRTHLRGSKYDARYGKVETAARERRAARDRAAQFDFMLADIRKTIAGDPSFERREAILERTGKAKELAGPKLSDVERMLSEYNASFAAFQKRAAESKPIVLAAGEAARKGSNLQLKGDYLGNWKTPKDWAEWTIEVPRGGAYRAELTYACAKDAGGECSVAAGASQVKLAVVPTGDWKTYRTVSLGTLTLPGGRLPLSVKAESVKGGGLMNLRALTLIPAP